MALQLRRGTDAERQATVFAEGELIYVTDTKRVYIGDNLTPGGILAGGTTSIIADTTPRLGGNLDLNAFQINGVGDIDVVGSVSADTITAGAFIGDGSGLTNLPGDSGGGVVEGQTYQINIAGADSSIIVDSTTGAISTNQIISNNLDISVRNINLTVPIIDPIGSRLNFIVESASLDLIQESTIYGRILFGKDDINGRTDVSAIASSNEGIYITHNTQGTLDTTKVMTWNGGLGLGVFAPVEKLEVAGNGIFTGYVQFGSLTETERDNLIATNGMVIYNTTTNQFQGYAAGTWVNLN